VSRLFAYRVHFGSLKSYVALSAENADTTAIRRAVKTVRTLYGRRPSKKIERIERAYPVPNETYADYRPIKVPQSCR
jgi:hypothetical protein